MEYVSKVNSQTKCDRVAEQLKDMIIRGVYKSGAQLPPEAALCEMFGVSRITVREGLKKLNMMGLVDIRQGKGTFVRGVDLSTFMKPMYQLVGFEEIDIKTIYDAREIIEGGIASLAAKNRTDEELRELEEILRRLREAIDAGDMVLSTQLDSEFHIYLGKMSHNTLLTATIATIEEISQACVRRVSKYFVSLDDCYTDHYNIYAAVRDRDEAQAIAVMAAHTEASMQLLLK